MVDVVVGVDQFVAGDFPHLCARTGRPTEDVVRLTISGGAVAGWLPLSAGARTSLRRTESTARALLVAAIAGWAVAGLLRQGWLLFLAFVVSLVAVATLLGRERGIVQGEVDPAGETVRLRHVHPRFAAAVRRAGSEAG